MRTRLVTGAVVVAAAALLTGQAAAAPTAVDITGVTGSGDAAAAVVVAGTAGFDATPVGAQDVGGALTPFQAAQAGVAGVDLKKGLIEPLPDGKGLRFIWQLGSLPPVVAPEGVRYNWSFSVDGKVFQLQAKRTNVASITLPDDPAGHATALAGSGFFQLRGNCTPNYQGTPVAGCPHLTFLPGTFDTATSQVRVDLPFGSAPEIVPGIVIRAAETAGSSIVAGFQAGVSTSATGAFINGWGDYVAGRAVQVASGFAGDDPTALEYTAATLASDGSFTASASTGNGENLVAARACEGATCIYDTVPLP